MDFTREPVIETVITPREGCKLVVRSSKGSSQEEYFVDAVEVVSFGNAFFFRSLEKPKCFLLPVVDYEVLEVREARMVLKHVGSDRSIKIAGGRKEKAEKETKAEAEEAKPPKKRERRRQQRRRKSQKSEETKQEEKGEASPEKVELPPPSEAISEGESESRESASNIIRSLLGSPPPLISETIGQYRETYQQAFYEKSEEEEEGEQPSENLPIEKSEDLPAVKEENLPEVKNEELPVAAEEQSEEASTPKKSLWDFTD